MQHYPIFLNLADARVLIAGGGDAALAKLRLLMKSQARLEVYAPDPLPEIVALGHRITLIRRPVRACDAVGARLVYGATEDAVEDARIRQIGERAGALVNIVDNLQDSDFLTPALVDRDPVIVAIGTEGAAPVLARSIKSKLEEDLPAILGTLAQVGKEFRPQAEALPNGAPRRDFWAEYYRDTGPRAFAQGGAGALRPALDALLARHLDTPLPQGRVDIVSAGPGDPDLMTLKARRLLERADVVIHDRLVTPEILELARREAEIIAVGKEGFGPSTPQADIHALMVAHAGQGAHVVRLKGGDASVFGRLDEETAALDAEGIDWSVIPGVTAASAAAASIGQSLTRRGRNRALRLVTAHDMEGYADHDWRALAAPGEVTAVYMGKRAARFVQGRMLMHGGDPDMPVSVVANAARPDQRIVAGTLATLPQAVVGLDGPAVILLGLAPHRAQAATGHPQPLEAAQ